MSTDGTAPRKPFDPSKHITRIKFRGGPERDYLGVAARVMWLRADHPGAVIETWLITDEPGARSTWGARVMLTDGSSATGFGSRKASDQRGDYFESGETRALGRALAHLGIATEYIDPDEMDEGRDDDGQVSAVDSGRARIDPRAPVIGGADPRKADPPRPATAEQLSGKAEPPSPEVAQPGVKASDDAIERFWPAVHRLGWSRPEVVEQACRDLTGGKQVRDLSAAGLKEFYRLLESGRLLQNGAGSYRVTAPPTEAVAAK